LSVNEDICIQFSRSHAPWIICLIVFNVIPLIFQILLVLAKTFPQIHVILGGHEHSPITLFQGKTQPSLPSYNFSTYLWVLCHWEWKIKTGETLIHKSGHDAYYLGRVDLEIHKTNETNWRDSNHIKTVSVFPQWKMILNKGTIFDLWDCWQFFEIHRKYGRYKSEKNNQRVWNSNKKIWRQLQIRGHFVWLGIKQHEVVHSKVASYCSEVPEEFNLFISISWAIFPKTLCLFLCFNITINVGKFGGWYYGWNVWGWSCDD
jgi:hypothetical protein